MGSGKTTVVAPLLSLFLADGQTLVFLAVPPPLLEFTRATLRERFASPILRKPVRTFHCDRFAPCDSTMHARMRRAVVQRSVVVTTPSAIKALMLKFVELLQYVQ